MNVFEVVTQKMIEKLEAGVVPWHMPWRTSVGRPCNLISGKEYRGINPMLLGCHYSSKYWLTYNQVKQLGGYVRSGERSSIVVFFKPIITTKPKTKEEEKKHMPFVLKYYSVFNSMQCDGITDDRLEAERARLKNIPEFKNIDACEAVWGNYPNAPALEHRQQRACYRPSSDTINMPMKESFDSEEEYYNTLFHEAVHSTGHESRLSRKTLTESAHFGSEKYSKEELIAEMGAAMLCAHVGIESKVFDNSASYLGGWLDVLKESKNTRLIVDAASAAQKAIDCIIGTAETMEAGE
jgi:antirestriction protein ArdC